MKILIANIVLFLLATTMIIASASPHSAVNLFTLFVILYGLISLITALLLQVWIKKEKRDSFQKALKITSILTLVSFVAGYVFVLLQTFYYENFN